MKHLAKLILALFIISALGACATIKKSPAHVKCPACGYEFDVPQQ